MIQKFKYRKYLSMIQIFFKVEFKIRFYLKIPSHKISCSISLQSQNPCRVQNPFGQNPCWVQNPFALNILTISKSLQGTKSPKSQNPFGQSLFWVQNSFAQNVFCIQNPFTQNPSGYKIPS